MNESIESTIPLKKVFSKNAIWGGTFLGGPLVAGYFLSENFKAIGQPDKVNLTWAITIVSTIIIFTGVYFIPEDSLFPDRLIPIAYTAIAYGVFKSYQEELCDTHLQAGGLTFGWWRIIGITIIGFLITLIAFLAVIFATDDTDYSLSSAEYGAETMVSPDVTTKTYGAVVKHEITYAKENITEREIDQIAQGFRKFEYFDYSVPKFVFVEKVDGSYVLSFSVYKEIVDDVGQINAYKNLRTEMNDFFPNQQVEFNLCVDDIENVIIYFK